MWVSSIKQNIYIYMAPVGACFIFYFKFEFRLILSSPKHLSANILSWWSTLILIYIYIIKICLLRKYKLDDSWNIILFCLTCYHHHWVPICRFLPNLKVLWCFVFAINLFYHTFSASTNKRQDENSLFRKCRQSLDILAWTTCTSREYGSPWYCRWK